jgi:hypothetical protein
MLSRVEIDYLKAPENFSPEYSKVIKHRLKCKVQALSEELALLDSAGFLQVMGKCNAVTDFRNSEQSLNQAALAKLLVARERFELSSAGPKPAMLGHYTTGLRKLRRFRLAFC